MNRQFLEFWGHFLLNAAQGQKQLEQMTAWMNQDFSGMDDLTAMFSRFYGLVPDKNSQSIDPKTWMKAVSEFQEAFNQYARLWGWVPQKEHLELIEKCQALETQVKKQQTTIDQLRGLLTEKGHGHAEMFENFQHMVKDQTRQFHSLMETFREAVDDKE